METNPADGNSTAVLRQEVARLRQRVQYLEEIGQLAPSVDQGILFSSAPPFQRRGIEKNG